MERLTKRIDENHLCIEVCEKACIEGNTFCPKCKPFTAVLKKLMEYEDLEEQGLLLKLPCKAGDVVYYPSEYWKRVFEYAVIGICVYTEDIWIKCGNGYSYILGREIFLTKAEAEKALEEMEK